jgi:hemoglobin
MEAPEHASPYAAIGGEDGVRALVSRFYGLMSTLPEAAGIRAMHEGDLEPMIEKLTTFIVGWMGGPRRYTERFGPVIIPAAHHAFAIGPEERDAWLLCFETALSEQRVAPEWHTAIMGPMRAMAEMCRTDGRRNGTTT